MKEYLIKKNNIVKLVKYLKETKKAVINKTNNGKQTNKITI